MSTVTLLDALRPVIKKTKVFKTTPRVKDAPEAQGFTSSCVSVFQVCFLEEIEISNSQELPLESMYAFLGDMFNIVFPKDQTCLENFPFLTTKNDCKENQYLYEKRIAPLDDTNENFLVVRIVVIPTEDYSVKTCCILFYGIKEIFSMGKN